MILDIRFCLPLISGPAPIRIKITKVSIPEDPNIDNDFYLYSKCLITGLVTFST